MSSNVSSSLISSKRELGGAFLCLAVLCAISQFANAQQVSGAILGKVTDPSDAPIANATVTAKDVERGTTFTAPTNDAGLYNMPRVPVGTYEVTVEAKGFQTSKHQSFTLEINQSARVDTQMKIGQVSEAIEVTGAAPLLQTEDTLLGTVINSRTNDALPLATRNYVELTLLAPGSVHPNPSTFKNGQATANGGRPYINGNREQSNNFLLDGMDNNQVSDNLVGFTPSPDAIQEFNLITNNAPADFGNYQGGVVSVSIKSGTNQLHGTVFEFFRNDVLNANSWAHNWNGSPRDKLRWNEFGGSLGGPIKKDRLFVFGDYQGERFDTPSATGPLTVFTAAERTGDFSQLLSQKGIQLYNPSSLDANGNRVAFNNNQIPIGMIDPVAAKLFASKYYPLPVNNNLQNNAFHTTGNQTIVDQGDVRADYNMTQGDHLFGRYSQSNESIPSFDSFALNFPGFFDAPTHNGVINYTRSIRPNIVNEARAGVNYVIVHNGGLDNGLGNLAQDLGIQNGNDRGPGLLGINISGGFVGGFGSSNIGTQQLFADTVIQLEDSLIITKGRHVIHTGFEYWRQRLDTFYAGNNGRTGFMTFSGRFTAGPSALAVVGPGAGAGEADFFLGLPDDIGRGVNTGSWGQRSNVFAAFVQDNIHLTNTLNVNIGLRYDNHTPWVEVKNRQVNFAPFSGALQVAGQSCIYNNCQALYNSYNGGLDFQPRAGFAWTPGVFNKKMVVRGAYTISSYLEGTGTNLRLPLNPPLNKEFEAFYHGTLPGSKTEQGLTTLTAATDPYAGAVIRLWDPNVRPAISQQWNFAIQQQFTNTTTLQVAYVGQHGTHLMVPMPYFQRQLLGVDSKGNPITAASPYLSGNPALANIQTISGTESNGSMRYDALQATLQKRFSDGLQAQVAYTYSKCMTNSSGYYGSWGGQATPTSPYFQNLYDMRAEWGPCYYDVTHVLTSYAVYDIPVGRHRKYASNMNAVADAVVGGWTVSPIFSVHGGYPLTISAGDASGTKSRGARADCIAPANVFGKQEYSGGGFQWFSPKSYAAPSAGHFGSCGVSTVRGPGLFSLDLSVQKDFSITESKKLQFRTEFINLPNHPILNSPGTGLGSQLGLVQSSQGERNIQFAMKFYF
jgi:hypothetical protein